MDQGSRLCIEYRKMYGYGRFRIVSYTSVYDVKADVMECAEGSNPDCDMANDQETIGVLDQGMFSRG